MATARPLMVFGSCVSRDTVSFMPDGEAQLRCYVARQSLLSVGKPDLTFTAEDVVLTSQFQHRMVMGDLRGDAIDRITAVASAEDDMILLWDLTEERCGVFETPAGGIITRTHEAMESGILSDIPDDWTVHRFGSGGHRIRFAASALDFKEVLSDLNLWNSTYVLAIDWAQTTKEGEPTPSSYGFSADTANSLFNEYYSFLAGEGWKIIRGPIDVYADKEHQWGLAPFHYDSGVYEEVVKEIFSYT